MRRESSLMERTLTMCAANLAFVRRSVVYKSLNLSLRRIADELGYLSAFEFLGAITMTKLVQFLRDESGASAAEYALILAIVGIGIVVAARALGTAISGAMTNAANTINNPNP
jgi:pilus assembly protein Flp/PilA